MEYHFKKNIENDLTISVVSVTDVDHTKIEFANGDYIIAKLDAPEILKVRYLDPKDLPRIAKQKEQQPPNFNGFGQYHYNKTHKSLSRYIGTFKNGKKHGFGALHCKDGSVFVGSFSNNKINGKAEFHAPNGDKYMGEFKDGQKNGQGEECCKFNLTENIVQSKYTGNYKNDLKCGYGELILTESNKKTFYKGQFSNGVYNGKGSIEQPNGNTYTGIFTNGNLTGVGIYLYKAGEKYYGHIKNGEKSGRGKMIFTNGDAYIV